LIPEIEKAQKWKSFIPKLGLQCGMAGRGETTETPAWLAKPEEPGLRISPLVISTTECPNQGLFLLLPSTISLVALSASMLRRQTGQIQIQARPDESFCNASGKDPSILRSMGSVA
jgi:hypothetical protein